ncbi:MAG: hypothetical protein H6767_06475 [Candidatus Peribacteria bacterium]|nr:MAG: hypothetical protein H6767_06475 [Candidatus Peribacteria bacterium]
MPKVVKKTNRAILHGFFIALIILFAIIVGIFQYLIPNWQETEDNKSQLQAALDEYNEVQSTGISFEQVQKLSTASGSQTSGDAYLKNILKNVTKDFYASQFSNTGSTNYQAFLTQKKKEIQELLVSKEIQERDKKIAAILPAYVDDISIGVDAGVTDFEFVNYVESILETFNLQYEGSLGISQLVQYGTVDTLKDSSGLDASIFYIPLSLELSGRKSDIIDFLVFTENVGNVRIDGQEVKTYVDNRVPRVLSGEKRTANYNIYEHQIFTIQNLQFSEYLDASSEVNADGKDFVDFVKLTQGKEKFDIEVELHFYVRGLPSYEIEKQIQEYFDKYDALKKLVLKKKKELAQISADKNTSSIISLRNNLVEVELYLESISKEINGLKKEIKKNPQDTEGYDTLKTYADVLSRIEANLNSKLSKLEQ